MKCILGKKIEMSQVFDKDGKVVPVTLIQTGDCNIVQVKTKEKDGYTAIKIGFENLPERKILKSGTPFRHLKEFRCDDVSAYNAGDVISSSIFSEGEKVKISGISKGKGFQGGVKRWGFHGRNATHGVKHEERTIGSTGCSTPCRVIKGKKMPGRTGSDRISVKNLEVVKVDIKNNVIAIKGAVPGRRGTLLEIRGE
jgi:large subunit ribosomal protein L3